MRNNDSQFLTDILLDERLKLLANTKLEKPTVVVLGTTGSGKSTMTTYLRGFPMVEDEHVTVNHEEQNISELARSAAAEIGHGAESKTEIPSLHNLGEDWIIADCPGLDDNRSEEITLKSSLSTELLTRKANIHAVIVTIKASQITEKASNEGISKLAATLSKILDLDKMGEQVFFVVTHAHEIPLRKATLLGRTPKSLEEKQKAVINSKINGHIENLRKQLTSHLEAYKASEESQVNIKGEQDLSQGYIDICGKLRLLEYLSKSIKERLRVVDWADSVTQEYVVSWISKQSKRIGKSAFRFIDYDPIRTKFDSRVEKILKEKIDFLQRYKEQKLKIEELIVKQRHHGIHSQLSKLINSIEQIDNEALLSQIELKVLTLANKNTTLESIRSGVERHLWSQMGRLTSLIEKLLPNYDISQLEIAIDYKMMSDAMAILKGGLEEKLSSILKKTVGHYTFERKSHGSVENNKEFNPEPKNLIIRQAIKTNFYDETQTVTEEVQKCFPNASAENGVKCIAQNILGLVVDRLFVNNKLIETFPMNSQLTPMEQNEVLKEVLMPTFMPVATFFGAKVGEFYRGEIVLTNKKKLESHIDYIDLSKLSMKESLNIKLSFEFYLSFLHSICISNEQYKPYKNVIKKIRYKLISDNMLTLQDAHFDNIPCINGSKVCAMAVFVDVHHQVVIHKFFSSPWFHMPTRYALLTVLSQLKELFHKFTLVNHEIELNITVLNTLKVTKQNIQETNGVSVCKKSLIDCVNSIELNGVEHTLEDELRCAKKELANIEKQLQQDPICCASKQSYELLGQANRYLIDVFLEQIENVSAVPNTTNDVPEETGDKVKAESSRAGLSHPADSLTGRSIRLQVLADLRYLHGFGRYQDIVDKTEQMLSQLTEQDEVGYKEILQGFLYYSSASKMQKDKAFPLYQSALEYFIKAQELSEDINVQNEVVYIMIKIGLLYQLPVMPHNFQEVIKETQNNTKLFQLLCNERIDSSMFEAELAIFLKSGFDINYQNVTGDTLLHSAVRNRHINIMNLLLDHGASHTIVAEATGTVVDLSIKMQQYNMVMLLFKHEIEMAKNDPKPNALIVLHKLALYLPKLKTQNDRKHHFECFAKIISLISHDDRQKWLLVSYNGNFLWQTFLSMLPSITQESLNNNSYLPLFIDKNEAVYFPLLKSAITHKQLEFCRYLFKHGTVQPIQLEISEKEGKSLLTYAVDANDLAIVSLLLEHGCDVNQTIKNAARTPLLSYIVQASRQKLLTAFLNNKKCTITAADHDGNTALHYAVLMGEVASVELLCQTAQKNNYLSTLLQSQNDAGNTALLLALEKKQYDCFEVIMKYVDVEGSKQPSWLEKFLNLQNLSHEYALQMAVNSMNVTAVKLICKSKSINLWGIANQKSLLSGLSTSDHISATILKTLSETKIHYCLHIVKQHLQFMAQNKNYKLDTMLDYWTHELNQCILGECYEAYRASILSAPLPLLDATAKSLAMELFKQIQNTFRGQNYLAIMKKNVKHNNFSVWRTVVQKSLSSIVNSQLPQSFYTKSSPSVFKSDKTLRQRAFGRALKNALFNYFYVSRAIFQGDVLKSDDGFENFKKLFDKQTPNANRIAEQCGLPQLGNLALAFNAVGSSLELISHYKKNKRHVEAARFVEAFGDCGPNSIAKREPDITISHKKLKDVVNTLSYRYQEQIEMCTLSMCADEISLKKSDGVWVFAECMAERIFEHIICGRSEKIDKRSKIKLLKDYFSTLGSPSDVYLEVPFIELPLRCVLAILRESSGNTKDWMVNCQVNNGQTKTIRSFPAGGLLVKTGLILESDRQTVYIRDGKDAEMSKHDEYGFCYISMEMEKKFKEFNEIEMRSFSVAIDYAYTPQRTKSDQANTTIAESGSCLLL